MFVYLKNIYHYLWAFLSAAFYGFPSRRIFVLGVTGTKGKSTVLELINAILEAAGKKTALVSSVRVKVVDDGEKNSASMTMPGRYFLQRFLRRAVEAGCDYALIEATSQGVLQYRHRFIDFDAVMVTNLHAEHIEAHGGFEQYRAAKCQFFADVRRSTKLRRYFFINNQMADRYYFERAVSGAGESESAANKVIYFDREDFIQRDLAAHYNLDSAAAKVMISRWLQNDFNLENAAAAAAFARTVGVADEVIFKTLENFKGVPGRLEFVRREPFSVVIDYAHTPDSLRAVYQAMVAASAASRDNCGAPVRHLIAVLGSAGGGRDKWKRKAMGHIAARFASHIILTNEDPYDENPLAILTEIEAGVAAEREASKLAVTYEIILDRRVAIKKAIALAKPGDVVILTGKGSEPWMHFERGRKIPWDERREVEEALLATST